MKKFKCMQKVFFSKEFILLKYLGKIENESNLHDLSNVIHFSFGGTEIIIFLCLKYTFLFQKNCPFKICMISSS